jgi:uncharacterized coiled-coil protein SlyX
VTYRIDDDVDYEQPEPKRRRLVPIAVVAALLAMVGIGSALLWRAYGNLALPSLASANGPAAAPVSAVEKGVGLAAFQAFQQQSAAQMQAATQLLASQQAEIKRLSDQMAVLSGKIDALQGPPAPAPKQAAPVRKKPAAPAPVAANPAAAPAPPLQLSR